MLHISRVKTLGGGEDQHISLFATLRTPYNTFPEAKGCSLLIAIGLLIA